MSADLVLVPTWGSSAFSEHDRPGLALAGSDLFARAGLTVVLPSDAPVTALDVPRGLLERGDQAHNPRARALGWRPAKAEPRQSTAV